MEISIELPSITVALLQMEVGYLLRVTCTSIVTASYN